MRAFETPIKNLFEHENGKRVHVEAVGKHGHATGHVEAAGKHGHATEDICMPLASAGVLLRNFLPALEVQANAKVVLKYFLKSTGMRPKTPGHGWQALIALSPPAALARALRALTGRFSVDSRLSTCVGPIAVDYPSQAGVYN